MAGLLDFNDPNALNTLGLIGGLLSARKGDNWPLMLQQAAMRQEAIRRGQIDEEMRREQMAQAKKMQEQQAQRQAAIASLAQQRPDLAPLLQIDPSMGVQRAFPDPTKNAYTLGPGQQRFEGGKPVASVPEKTPDWKDPEYVRTQKEIRSAGAPQVTTNVLPPREVFKDSLALKKDFDAQPEVKGFKEVQQAWDQISTALKNPSAANDLAAATKFMKLLDPGSVVRESELAMAMQASGALDRMANYHNLLMRGQKLTPTQRQDFYRAGEALYEASKTRYGQTVQQYEGIGKEYGLDQRFIQNPVNVDDLVKKYAR